MEHMSDLLQAEQREIDLISLYINELEKELNINTTTKLIKRYEDIFNLKNNGTDTLEECRIKIIAKLNGRGVTRVENIKEIAELLTECKCSVMENIKDYSFTVNIEFFPSNKIEKLEYLIAQIDVIKPAHLRCIIGFIYNKHKTFKSFKHKELSKFTHRELREKEIKVDDYFNRYVLYENTIYEDLSSKTYGELRRKGEWHNGK